MRPDCGCLTTRSAGRRIAQLYIFSDDEGIRLIDRLNEKHAGQPQEPQFPMAIDAISAVANGNNNLSAPRHSIRNATFIFFIF